MSIPRPIQRLVRCKTCKNKITSYFPTSGGGFALFCEPCFQTINAFYKREIRQREEEGTILEEELDNGMKKKRKQKEKELMV